MVLQKKIVFLDFLFVYLNAYIEVSVIKRFFKLLFWWLS